MYKTTRLVWTAVILLVCLCASISSGEEQHGFWKSYFNSNDIRSIAAGDDFIWCATAGGLVRWDRLDGSYIHFTKADGLLSNDLRGIAVDGSGFAWIIHDDVKTSVSHFDGSAWKIFDNEDIGMPNRTLSCVFADSKNRIWLGTDEGGIARYDGTSWKRFDPIRGLEQTRAVAVDRDGSVWIGTRFGVLEWDGASWNEYTIEDGLIGNTVTSIAVDLNNVKWIGTTGGISSFSDFRQDESGQAPENITLRGNYPNPFNMVTRISFELASWGPVTITVYNSAGQKIREMREGMLPRGTHSVLWDSTDENGATVSSGMYFFRIASRESRAFGRMMLLK